MSTKFNNAKPISNEDESRIQKQIASDPDAPEATDEQIAQAKPFAEAFPDLMESIRRSRGRPRVESPKEAITLRVDPAVVSRFKATGKNWRGKMAEILEKAKL